jgi:uncharacterized protein (TIGR02597 family)
MRKKMFYFLGGIALATGMISADANITVATVPEGMIAFAIPHGKTTYLSLPLTNTPTYTSVVTAVTTNTISVDDTPPPFTSNLATPAVPYFVKFLSGKESGRVLLITSNTSGSLALDTTDHVSGSAIALTTTSCNVQAGDAFEIFRGDTLASVFGDGTAHNPLLLTGGRTASAADAISLFTTAGVTNAVYFFNTAVGYWEQNGDKGSANNTIIYPYSAFIVASRSSHPDATLVLAGRVSEVPAETRMISNGTVYSSSHYATDIKLSQLQFGSNWTTGATANVADTLSVWNDTLGRFDIFYQKPDLTWRKSTDAATDQSNYTIAAGAVTTIAKRGMVSGAASFLASSMPYSLD